MNWNLIKEKYPKSEALIDKCIRTDRDLYDFFDEQDIIIEIGYFSEVGEFSYATYKYALPNGVSLDSGYGYKTRTEAEEQAFIKAFEILEDI